MEAVRKTPRAELLKDQTEKAGKDPHAIFVCTWHPKLKELPSILSKNYEILRNDPRLREVFPDKPIIAFRRKKNLKNILCRNDVREQKQEKSAAKCKGCQLCRIMSNKGEVVNDKNGLSVKVQPGGHCKSTGVIYAIRCKKCKLLYIGETKKAMSDRLWADKYDIGNRPDNCDLAKYCRTTNHNLEEDLEVFIVKHGIHDQDKRRRIENKFVCKLQT